MPKEKIKCKRIIDGKTYNTETATLLWSCGETPDGPPIEEYLYKTRHGAYFLYSFCEQMLAERIKPLEPAEAKELLGDQTDIYEAEFGDAAEAGDPEARITLRVPRTLQKRMANVAKEQEQSLNAWIVRCIEQCAAAAEREGA